MPRQVVTAWNGMAIGAFATASRALAAEAPPLGRAFPIEGTPARAYLQAAIGAASAVRERLWDPASRRLKRSFCRNTSAVDAFADDCAPRCGPDMIASLQRTAWAAERCGLCVAAALGLGTE